MRFRGGFLHAIRSPNIFELYRPQVPNFPNFANQDPCNFNSSYRTGPDAAQVTALCTAQAAVAGGASFSQPFGQAEAIVGGNPDLKPETADSWTFGVVMSPEFDSRFFQRMGFTIDYFSIELEDVISAVGATTIITRCFNNEGANPTYDINNQWCSLYDRDQSDGRVIDLEQFQRNQSVWKTSGIDATVNWGMDVGPGALDMAMLISYVDSFETQTTNVDPFNEFAGTIGNTTGSATPDLRGTLQASYSMDNLMVQVTTRYISAMDHANLVTNPNATATGTDATWYTDLSARYDVTDSITLRMGVNNIANQQPRLYTPNVQASTDPSTFDVLGRRFFVGFDWRL